MNIELLRNKLGNLRQNLRAAGIAVLSCRCDHVKKIDEHGTFDGDYSIAIKTEYGDANHVIDDDVVNVNETVDHLVNVVIPAKITQLLIADKSVYPIQDSDNESDIQDTIGEAIDWEIGIDGDVSIVTDTVKVRVVAEVDVPTIVTGSDTLPGVADTLEWQATLIGPYAGIPLATLEPGHVYTYEILEVR